MDYKNKYYNYMLLDPRKPFNWEYQGLKIKYEPFYIGKGSGDRVLQHYRKSCVDNPYTKHKIEKLKNGGYVKLYIKYNENSLEQDAFIEEINSIKYIKENFPNFKLTNMTKGGDQPEIHTGKDNPNSIPVYQYDLNSGEFINEYDNSVQAAVSLNKPPKSGEWHILECCRGKLKTSFGYIWRFDKKDKIEIPHRKRQYLKYSKLIAYNDTEQHKFNSTKEACEWLGINSKKSHIADVIKGNRHTFMKYYWKIEN